MGNHTRYGRRSLCTDILAKMFYKLNSLVTLDDEVTFAEAKLEIDSSSFNKA